MAFKSYHVTPLSNGSWLLTHPEPVRFSGPRGLVARHLAALRPVEAARWSLEDTDWLRIVHPGSADTSARWLVFEQTEDDGIRLSRLLRIHGMVAHDQTELLLTLSPLQTSTPATRLIVTAPVGARTWSEELALDGAPHRADAPWSWCERALHVGSAVFG